MLAHLMFVNQLQERELITPDEYYDMRDNTHVTEADIWGTGEIQFLFCTKTPWGKICQYAIYSPSRGKFQFRENLRWFVPGDWLFETFTETLNFLKKNPQQ